MTIDLSKLITAEMKQAQAERQQQEAINTEARAYLASTDWYVIRFQETAEPIPPDILIERQAARERVVEPAAE